MPSSRAGLNEDALRVRKGPASVERYETMEADRSPKPALAGAEGEMILSVGVGAVKRAAGA
jgi:hypothetical protein